MYGLPFFYDFFVRDLGWTRQQVTSGNAYSKLLIGPLFGFLAGWFIDRFGPRRLMLAGILMAGCALVGLGTVSTLGFFYLFYLFNALGYVCGGPLPNQVLLSRWFDKNRGKAMGFAYLGIGVGGAIVPLLAHALTERFGWQTALQVLGGLMILIAFPMAWFVKEKPEESAQSQQSAIRQSAIRNAAALPRAGPEDARLLPPDRRLDVLDRRGGRDDAEPQAVPEPRREAGAGRGRADCVAGAGGQPHRPHLHGLPRRSITRRST